MKRWTVVLLLATALAVAACGNDGSRSDLIATATDGPQITTTPLPLTPTDAPPTIGPAPTSALVTPMPAAEGGRADCPQDWAVHSDPEGYFSLCYPAEWAATSRAQYHPDFGAGLSLRSTDVGQTDSVYMHLYWEKTNASDLGLRSEPCENVDPFSIDVREITITLAERSVLACAGDLLDHDSVEIRPSPFRATTAEISLAPGEGYVRLYFTENKAMSQAGRDRLSAILQSLRLGK